MACGFIINFFVAREVKMVEQHYWKGSEFQIDGATMENAQRCIVETLTQGTKSLPSEEG